MWHTVLRCKGKIKSKLQSLRIFRIIKYLFTMKVIGNVLIVLIAICVIACGPEPVGKDPVPALVLSCPPDMSIVLSSDTVPSSEIDFPEPTEVNNCGFGEITYTVNGPEQIYAGTFMIEYYVSSPCGSRDTCSFALTASFTPTEIDYRTRFVGTYTGREICYSGYNYSTPFSDKTITVQVSLSENPNKLKVNDDEMVIDSTGSCPYPSCCYYRFYAQNFWADSLYIYKNSGSIGSPTECSFRGKKQ